MNCPKIAVLMSTYNGEQYIKEQIDSILNQADVEVYLFVRDDGSKDNTVNILEEYAQQGKLKYAVGRKNLGSGMSFLKLLSEVCKKYDFDYYSFADQDDIWLERKLISAIDMIKETDVPALYASNQYIYQNGENKGLRFTEDIPDNSISVRISHNIFYGCTMVFNRSLAEKIVYSKVPPKDIIYYRYHDTWAMIVAISLGKFIYDSNSYIYYRIHEKNEVGLRKVSLKEHFNNFLKKGKGSTERANLRSKTAKALISRYDDINPECKDIISLYADYQNSLKDKLALLRCREIIENSGENRIMFMLKVIFNFV